jgi:hypothetical protein
MKRSTFLRLTRRKGEKPLRKHEITPPPFLSADLPLSCRNPLSLHHPSRQPAPQRAEPPPAVDLSLATTSEGFL